MIDDEQLAERLRRAHAAEQAPALDPARMLRAGQQARRRRTAARWSGVAATCAGTLVVAAGLAGGWGRTPDQVAEPVPGETPSFMAVTVLDAYEGVPEGVAHPFGAANGVETFEADPPLVDLAAGTVTLWTGGSYSCPTWPKAIRAFDDTIDIVVGLPDGVRVCTADAGVDTYVVELPPGYAPDGTPTVRVLHQGPGWSDEVPRDLPADDAGGCRPALTVCAMYRWLDDILDAAGLDPVSDVYGRMTAGDDFLVGEDRVGVTLSPPERERRVPIEVSRTTDIGPVVVEHGTAVDGVVPAAVLTCGGFMIRLEGSAWMSADVFAQTAESIAATITECPADLDALVALHRDLGR